MSQIRLVKPYAGQSSGLVPNNHFMHMLFCVPTFSGILLNDLTGFGLLRRGRLAFQLGPIVANSNGLAVEIFIKLLTLVRGSVFIDVPVFCQKLGEELQNKGFTIQRSFARMALARSEPFGHPARLFAIAGPEFG